MKENIDNIVERLEKGEIIITPTDTVYGIIADAYNQEAINKIFIAKERSYEKPFLVLISNIEMLDDIVLGVDEFTKQIINKFWPGPLTILFEKKDKISDLVTANSKYVAVRFPNNKNLNDIVEKLKRPVVAPSANISGKPSAHSYEDLEESLKNKVDYIIDDGVLKGCESTLIQVKNDEVIVLREGAVSKKEIVEFIDKIKNKKI